MCSCHTPQHTGEPGGKHQQGSHTSVQQPSAKTKTKTKTNTRTNTKGASTSTSRGSETSVQCPIAGCQQHLEYVPKYTPIQQSVILHNSSKFQIPSSILFGSVHVCPTFLQASTFVVTSCCAQWLPLVRQS